MPTAEKYLDVLVTVARGVLGDELVGAYAAGSLALGAFEPHRSDIDVALVTRAALTETTKHELVQRLRHESLPCPARGLELVVYREAVARSSTAEPGFELELNTGPRMSFRATYRPEDRPETDGRFWYGLDRCILRQCGAALVGPPARELFAAPSPTDTRALLLDALRWWIDHTAPGEGPTAGADDAVLGACRALIWHRSGEWTAKVDAGRRLLRSGYGAEDLIEEAIAARSGGRPPSGDRARAFQLRVLHDIAT